MGNTLIPARDIQSRASRKAARVLVRSGYIRDESEFLKAFYEADQSMDAYDMNHLFTDRRIIEKALRHLRIEPAPCVVGLFLTHYRDAVRKQLVPDRRLTRLFRELYDRGFKLGVVSDGTVDEQLEQLVRIGIIRFLRVCVFSEDVEVEKPERLIFEKAAHTVGEDPEKIAMVGDDMKRDVQGAKVLGMRTILLRRGNKEHEHAGPADFVISDLYAIMNILRFE
jgi:HAD superfamily hydrolase (TIGR01509 family)